MKILCISDIISPVIYSNKIVSRFKDVDMVLSSGDLDLDYYEFIISSLNKPLLFVFGNHNLQNISKYLKRYINIFDEKNHNEHFGLDNGSIYVGDRVKRVKKIIVAGLGGSMRYNKGLNQFSDFQMFVKSLKLIPKMLFNKIVYGRYLDVLLTHSPPYGIHDQNDLCHRGFKTFLWFMKIFKPRFLIHGHVHLYDLNKSRRTKYCKTEVVNGYNFIVLEI